MLSRNIMPRQHYLCDQSNVVPKYYLVQHSELSSIEERELVGFISANLTKSKRIVKAKAIHFLFLSYTGFVSQARFFFIFRLLWTSNTAACLRYGA